MLLYLSTLERLPTINKLFGLSGIAHPEIGTNVTTGLENSKTVENGRYPVFTYVNEHDLSIDVASFIRR